MFQTILLIAAGLSKTSYTTKDWVAGSFSSQKPLTLLLSKQALLSNKH